MPRFPPGFVLTQHTARKQTKTQNKTKQTNKKVTSKGVIWGQKSWKTSSHAQRAGGRSCKHPTHQNKRPQNTPEFNRNRRVCGCFCFLVILGVFFLGNHQHCRLPGDAGPEWALSHSSPCQNTSPRRGGRHAGKEKVPLSVFSPHTHPDPIRPGHPAALPVTPAAREAQPSPGSEGAKRLRLQPPPRRPPPFLTAARRLSSPHRPLPAPRTPPAAPARATQRAGSRPRLARRAGAEAGASPLPAAAPGTARGPARCPLAAGGGHGRLLLVEAAWLCGDRGAGQPPRSPPRACEHLAVMVASCVAAFGASPRSLS